MAKRKAKKKRRTDPKQMTTDARHYLAYRMRIRGHKLREIKDALGYATESGAQKAVESGQKKLHYDPTLDTVRLAEDRLEELLQGFWSAATAGRLGSGDRAIKILSELNKIQGNYAPDRMELGGVGGGPIVVEEIIIELTDDDDDDDDEKS